MSIAAITLNEPAHCLVVAELSRPNFLKKIKEMAAITLNEPAHYSVAAGLSRQNFEKEITEITAITLNEPAHCSLAAEFFRPNFAEIIVIPNLQEHFLVRSEPWDQPFKGKTMAMAAITNGKVCYSETAEELPRQTFIDTTFKCFTLDKICQCVYTFIGVSRTVHWIDKTQWLNMEYHARVVKLAHAILKAPEGIKHVFECAGNSRATYWDLFHRANACIHPFHEIGELGSTTHLFEMPKKAVLKTLTPFSLIFARATSMLAPENKAPSQNARIVAFFKLLESIAYVALGALQVLGLAAIKFASVKALLPVLVLEAIPNLILVCAVAGLASSIIAFYAKNWGAPLENSRPVLV